jgi:carbonic anhydrase/acetyltransferase-like protein (isoleucine patch superfamily)
MSWRSADDHHGWAFVFAAGDINAITVGDKTNIQDNVVVHVARHSLTSAPAGGPKPTVIGSAVTIGHGATLHACTIGDGCLVRSVAGGVQ